MKNKGTGEKKHTISEDAKEIVPKNTKSNVRVDQKRIKGSKINLSSSGRDYHYEYDSKTTQEGKNSLLKTERRDYELNDQKDSGERQDHSAFLFRLNDCSSVLIHANWLLTSQECISSSMHGAVPLKYDNGSWAYPGDTDLKQLKIHKNKGAQAKPGWKQPLKLEVLHSGEDVIWRLVEEIILEPSYLGPSQIYLGGDLALLRLAPKTQSPDEGFVAPICLPDANFKDLNEDRTDQLYLTGYGQRRIQFCMTNIKGPEKFSICGRQEICTGKKAQTVDKCPIEFTYKNETHNKCLTTPNPSTEDPLCIKLNQKMNIKKTAYVFSTDMQQLLATCIPESVQKNERGWCATQGPSEPKPSVPGYSSGWGFCSSEEDQKNCDETADKKLKNTTKIQVSQLDNNFCKEKLEQNLRQENTVAEGTAAVFQQRIFCGGKNVSEEWDMYEAYKFENKSDTFVQQKMEKQVIETLAKSNISNNGLDGVACQGDAGAPLFKYVSQNGIQKPVLIGIFSFMLWGTCRGRQEPSYFTRINHYVDSFILKHVPRNETCLINA